MGVVLCSAMCVLMATAVGGVPPYINYQGILTDDAGMPLDGVYDLTFKIYNDSTGGVALWTELHPDAEVDDGLFNVILGKTTSFMDSLGIDEDPWIAVQVDSDPEIVPRMELTSVPYAFEAMKSTYADSVDWYHVYNMPPGFADGVDDVGTGADSDWTVYMDNMYSAVPGNVGIGTTAPFAKLTVVDSVLNNIEIGGNYFGLSVETDSLVPGIVARSEGSAAVDGYSETSAGVAGSSRDNYGVYGIGIYAPAVGVYGYASDGTGVYGYSFDGTSVHAENTHGTALYAHSTHSYSGYFAGGEVQINSTTNGSALDLYNTGFTSGTMVNLQTNQGPGTGDNLLRVRSGGGSDDGMQFIECDRFTGFIYDIEFRVNGNGNVYADGSYTGPADFSEMVAVSSGAFTVEPGDVMVIDPAGDREIVKSSGARSTMVAGIYSTKPGFVGSEREWDKAVPGSDEVGTYSMDEMAFEFDEIPLAVVGIVPCKVSAENGAISPGDLLVTSSIPGHAMRDDDPKAGTIVGKAMQSLDSGTGSIKVLVTLQ
jgi:hypothetical protein